MNRNLSRKTATIRTLSGAATVAAIAGGWILVASLYSKADAAIILQPIVHGAYDPTQIDRDISQREEQVKGDPGGAIGFAMLSGAYLARSRESDSDIFAWKAEAAATKSLALRTRRNDVAWLKMIQSLLEQHRFQDALAKTELGLKTYPGNASLLREKADILVEIGQLDAAAALLAKVPSENDGAESAPIYARIASIRGKHDESIALYRKGMSILETNSSVPQQGLAWYVTKIATEHELAGRPDAAQKTFDDSLKLYPRSYKAWLGEARLALKRKDYKAAIDACNEVQKIANSLDAVAMRADAYLAMGDKAKAAAGYADVKAMYEKEVKTFDGMGKGGPLHVKPIDRQFATFAVKHHMFEAEALPAARRDHQNRPDEIAVVNLRELSR